MKRGDLVKYKSSNFSWDRPYEQWRGVILRCIPGTSQIKVVRWQTGLVQSLPAKDLEIVDETR